VAFQKPSEDDDRVESTTTSNGKLRHASIFRDQALKAPPTLPNSHDSTTASSIAQNTCHSAQHTSKFFYLRSLLTDYNTTLSCLLDKHVPLNHRLNGSSSPTPARRTSLSTQHIRPLGIFDCWSDGLELAA